MKLYQDFRTVDLLGVNKNMITEKIKYKINYKKNINTLNFNISDSIKHLGDTLE